MIGKKIDPTNSHKIQNISLLVQYNLITIDNNNYWIYYINNYHLCYCVKQHKATHDSILKLRTYAIKKHDLNYV